MTFKEIQDAVLSDRFDETKRERVKEHINYRYWRIWVKEAWAFKLTAVEASLATSAQTLSLDTLGLHRVHAVFDSSTYATMYREYIADRPEDFYRWATSNSGRGYAFTVFGDTLRFDRPVSSATDVVVVGEVEFNDLVADGDVPLLPDGSHYILVHGASSEGLRMENDPTWQGFEQDYQAGLQDLKDGYLVNVRTFGDSYPAWP